MWLQKTRENRLIQGVDATTNYFELEASGINKLREY